MLPSLPLVPCGPETQASCGGATEADSRRTGRVSRDFREQGSTRLFQECENLFARDARIVLEEIRDRLSALEKINEGIDRDACSDEHRRASEYLRIGMYDLRRFHGAQRIPRRTSRTNRPPVPGVCARHRDLTWRGHSACEISALLPPTRASPTRYELRRPKTKVTRKRRQHAKRPSRRRCSADADRCARSPPPSHAHDTWPSANQQERVRLRVMGTRTLQSSCCIRLTSRSSWQAAVSRPRLKPLSRTVPARRHAGCSSAVRQAGNRRAAVRRCEPEQRLAA